MCGTDDHARSRDDRLATLESRRPHPASLMAVFVGPGRGGWLSAATQTVGATLLQPALPACAAAAQQGLRANSTEKPGHPPLLRLVLRKRAPSVGNSGAQGHSGKQAGGAQVPQLLVSKDDPRVLLQFLEPRRVRSCSPPSAHTAPFLGRTPMTDGAGGMVGFHEAGGLGGRGLSRDAFRAASM